MPVPQSTMISELARRSFERLQSGPKPGPSGTLARGGTQGAVRGAAGFDYLVYIDQISGAIRSAWATWQATATFVGIVINGPTAAGGTVVGPPLAPLILALGPSTPKGLALTRPIAAALGAAWLQLTASLKVPGLPWYPAFAAMPTPVAPPMPNVPTPVAALTMVSAVVSKSVLKTAMVKLHPGASGIDQNLFEAVAESFEQNFQMWKVSTMVSNVLGTGPVPTFAPPYVPVGPVVGGVGTMTPGGFV